LSNQATHRKTDRQTDTDENITTLLWWQ